MKTMDLLPKLTPLSVFSIGVTLVPSFCLTHVLGMNGKPLSFSQFAGMASIFVTAEIAMQIVIRKKLGRKPFDYRSEQEINHSNRLYVNLIRGAFTGAVLTYAVGVAATPNGRDLLPSWMGFNASKTELSNRAAPLPALLSIVAKNDRMILAHNR